jgi:nitroreductase
MDAITCIQTRRSVRRFEDRPVPGEVLNEIIADAAMAPSWKNCQPIRYVAVSDPAIKEKIAANCVMDFKFNANTISHCPLLIVQTIVHGRSGFERDGSYSTSKEDRWEMYDAGIAAQTLCLSAHAHGLGTVIMGIFDEAKLAEVLQLPESQLVGGLIAMGYPAEDPAAPKRKSVEDLLRCL